MLEPIALIFKINNGLITRGLDGLSDEDVWRQIATSANPIGWLIGHLTEARGSAVRAMGGTFDPGWASGIFSRGSEMRGRTHYPTREAIEAAWQATHAAMREAFASVSADRLAATPPRSPVPGLNTVSDLISFLALHESYHVGQIGLIRKQLGHSPIAG